MKRYLIIAFALCMLALSALWITERGDATNSFISPRNDTPSPAVTLEGKSAMPKPSAAHSQGTDKAAKQALNKPLQPQPVVLGSKTGRPWEEIAGWNELPPRERLVKLLSQSFALKDRGAIRPLELAKDELYVRDPQLSPRKMHTIPEQADAEGVLRQAEAIGAKNGRMPQLVFYPPGTQKRTEQNRRVLSDQVLMKPTNTGAAISTANQLGLQQTAALAAVPGYVVARDNRFPGAAIIAAADLAGRGEPSAMPELAMQMQSRFLPNDTYFSKQWHLSQSGTNHVNVKNVWDTNKGAGIVIGVIDNGLQTDHPDLNPNVDTTLPTRQIDINDGDNNPSPYAPVDDPLTTDYNEAEDGDCHGTSVAGLAAAKGNNGVGVSGVAPDASLVGIRLTAAATTASEEAQAFGHFNDVISIKNNSWGPTDVPWILGVIDPVSKAAFANGVANGRGGLGTIYTWAGGNGREDQDQSNKDGYANSIEVFAIGALTRTGAPASYSEYGTNLIASAPADGVYTTDLMGNAGYNPTQNAAPLSNHDYTNDFNGTSAATPVVSGVIALMLKANPSLSWRDVKEILLRSGQKVAPTDKEWTSRVGGRNGMAPIKHNPKYGGGMVDAQAAVALATTWTNLAALSPSLAHSVSGDTPIPDNSVTGITKNFDFSGDPNMRVEHVEISLNAHHTYRGDLEIQLISPSGTISTLAYYSTFDGGEEFDQSGTALPKPDRGYFDWVFSSVRHWGEGSNGVWKLVIRDKSSLDTGTFHSATVTLHGVNETPASITTPPAGMWASTGSTSTLSVVASGSADLAYLWRKVTSPTVSTALSSQTTNTLTFSSLALTDAANYDVVVSNATGQVSSSPVPLCTYVPAPSDAAFNLNSLLKLTTSAKAPSGATVTYQWFKDSNVLNNETGPGARISGAQSTALSIKDFQVGDAGIYHCEVSISGLAAHSTGDTNVVVRYAPALTTVGFPTGLTVSSAPVSIPLSFSDTLTSVKILGLPKGLIYDTKTGTITGIPLEGATNKLITIISTNLAGTVTSTLLLTIAELPSAAYGTFNGFIARDSATNSNYGGSINLVITKTGSFSGSVVIAGVKKAFTGARLVTTAAADPTATVLISRGTKPVNTYYTLTFGINSVGKLTNATIDSDEAVSPVAISAWRNPYSTGIKATAGSVIGRHNIALAPPSGLTTKPEGFSHGSVVVTDLGVATIAIKPADNTAVFTMASSIALDGSIPLHQMLYLNKGSMQGTLLLTDATPNTMSGNVTWLKTVALTDAAAAKAKIHPGTFDFGVSNGDSLTVAGCEYGPLAPGTILWGVRVPSMLASPFDANAQLTFTLGDIATSNVLSDLNKAFRLSTTHAVAFELPNPAAVTFKVVASTGAFTGTAILKETSFIQTRALSFSGVVIPNESKAKGFFIVPMKLSSFASPVPMTSGAVNLTQKN